MTQKPRACLFGAGEMAATHAMTLTQDGRLSLAYIVDPSPDRAQALAAATGAQVVDPDTAFADPAIAAYLIASPPRTHADYLDRAAKTRAHIFCEKPIDHDITRARACLTALKGRETFVQMGFNRRFDDQFIALKAAITAGPDRPPRTGPDHLPRCRGAPGRGLHPLLGPAQGNRRP